MKAIRVHQFGPPEVLQLDEVATPQPGPHQVLVRISAAGVNPVETYIRAGRYGERQFPYTPGTDAAGVVEAVGSSAKRFMPGQRVYTHGSVTGTYAQFAVCDESRVQPLPEHVSFEQGAALGVPYPTAHRSLFHRGQAKPGEILLVHGASGGVGIASVQLARAFGLTVIGTAGTDNGRKLVLNEGAHHVFDHTQPDYLDQILQFTGRRGVDLILEMLANVNLAKDLPLLAKFGRVVVIGSRGTIEIDPRNTMMRDADIRGMTLFNVADGELAGIHAALVAGLENRTLRPIVGKRFPLAEAPRAHHEVIEAKSYGKIVLIP